MNLHNRIMRLGICVPDRGLASHTFVAAYKTGHRDARHAAAELAITQDAMVEELALALVKLADAVETRKPEHEGYLSLCAREARAAIARAAGA